MIYASDGDTIDELIEFMNEFDRTWVPSILEMKSKIEVLENEIAELKGQKNG